MVLDYNNARTALDGDTIAQARAISVLELAQTNLHLRGRRRHFNGPCPHCGGTDRFWIDAGKNKFGCRGCNERGSGAIDFMMFIERLSFLEAVEKLVGLPAPAPRQPYDGTAIRRQAASLWWEHQPIIGSIAEKYLREARHIHGPLPGSLAFLPPWLGRLPAMIAAFGLPDGSKVEAVHLTFLKPDGSGKADIENPKQFRGEPSRRPIVIASPTDVLAITEGIEDALSVYEATGLGVWAAGSAVFMPALAAVVPRAIKKVVIWAHDDATGQRNALVLAKALHQRGGIKVFIEGLA